ncbi:MAG: hypothetical protein KDB69_04230, partial [Acidimicrobiia bacterium]|nr:hypothetical protein [Acidimicrobiia bacterium]
MNTVINFPAFPNAGGPFIVEATVRPTSVSGAGATEVYLVFNEPISGASVATTDFVATGFTFTGVTVSGNVVTLDNASGAASGDQVQLAEIGCIDGSDGSSSTDLSPFTIGEGPVVIGVQVFNYENQDPTDDEVLVIFDADVEYGGGDSEDNTFNLTPVFNGATLASAFEAVNFANDGIRITQDGASTVDFNKIAPGVAKLWVTNSKVVWSDATGTDNNVDLKYEMDNVGPHLTAAYYNSNDDVLWTVFSEPVDPGSIVGDFTVHFDTDVDGGGWAPTGGVISSAFPGLVTSSLLVTNITNLGAAVAETDEIANHDDVSGTGLDDYQGLDGAINSVFVDVGPGIIRASYDDHRTSTRTDDDVYVWISETVNLGTVSVSDFDFLGFDESGLTLTVVAENIGSLARLTFHGFDNTNYPLPGSRIMALPGNGILGALTGDELADRNAICIEDESRPWTLNVNEDLDLTYDRWNGADTDSFFIAWSESGGDDSDQYYMFYTATPGLDDDWMNANLGNAIPLGNLHPEATDGLIRIGFTVMPGVDVGTDGDVLMEGDQMRVVIAAADFQGNVARIQDGTEATHTFGPFIVGPLCAPRDFISDLSIPAEADSALWDSDVIHVVGDSTGGMVWHYVYGDSLSIACDADSVLVYDGDDPLTDNLLGSGPIGPGGSFPPIHIGSPEVDCIYVFSKQDVEMSEGTPIIFDRLYPEILGDTGTPYADYIFDPWNPYRIYNDGDYVNIRLLAVDPVSEDICAGAPFRRGGGPTYAPNPLLHIWGDFTQLDSSAGNITGFGTPA